MAKRRRSRVKVVKYTDIWLDLVGEIRHWWPELRIYNEETQVSRREDADCVVRGARGSKMFLQLMIQSYSGLVLEVSLVTAIKGFDRVTIALQEPTDTAQREFIGHLSYSGGADMRGWATTGGGFVGSLVGMLSSGMRLGIEIQAHPFRYRTAIVRGLTVRRIGDPDWADAVADNLALFG